MAEENRSAVGSVRADFYVNREDAAGKMADELRFSIRGSRCGTLAELGAYMHKRIDEFIARLSPDGIELDKLRQQIAELGAMRDADKPQRPRPQPQGNNAIPRAQPKR